MFVDEDTWRNLPTFAERVRDEVNCEIQTLKKKLEEERAEREAKRVVERAEREAERATERVQEEGKNVQQIVLKVMHD
uniref:Uncharacterized protein n=1 Tax=Fagus sylvatica TaxID=28930 RepID=A0A2N9EXF8_FAGSY